MPWKPEQRKSERQTLTPAGTADRRRPPGGVVAVARLAAASELVLGGLSPRRSGPRGTDRTCTQCASLRWCRAGRWPPPSKRKRARLPVSFPESRNPRMPAWRRCQRIVVGCYWKPRAPRSVGFARLGDAHNDPATVPGMSASGGAALRHLTDDSPNLRLANDPTPRPADATARPADATA
jgi:hypothetical protein